MIFCVLRKVWVKACNRKEYRTLEESLCANFHGWVMSSKSAWFYRLDKPFIELLPALMGPSSFLPLFPALLDLPSTFVLQLPE